MIDYDKYLVLDLETETKNNSYNRMGSPWENNVIVSAYKQKDNFAQALYDNKISMEYFLTSDVLVAHNAKFELLWLWFYPEFQEWLKKGGRIWCTQYAHYLLTGLKDKYPKLRTIAVENYGCPYRHKHIDDLFFKKDETIKQLEQEIFYLEEHGVNEDAPIIKEKRIKINELNSYQDLNDLPEEVVLEDCQSDVEDTEVIYLQQLKKAKELNMMPLIEGLMEGLLATTEMEFNGMAIDMEVLQKNKVILQDRIQTLEKDITEEAMRYWK
jgi:DNA polymerase-1